MSVSLLEVIEAGGYDLTTYDDALWLLRQQRDFQRLIDQAEQIVEDQDEIDNNIMEAEYNDR